MKDNGFKILLTIGFIALCVYYLYPSVHNLFLSNKIESMSGEERTAYEQENNTTIKTVKDKSLKLGLDLLGGMHVTLEVKIDALVRELATDVDQPFEEVLADANTRADNQGISLIDAFSQAFTERDPNALLSRYFRDTDANITRRSTNAEVVTYLQAEADEAILRAIEIIRQRVDRFGVTEPSIQRQGARRIVVELPGVTEQDRVRTLLKGTAKLEFRLMAEPQALLRTAQLAIEAYQEEAAMDSTSDALLAADSAGVVSDTTSDIDALLALEDDGPVNRLLQIVQPYPQASVRFGVVSEQDTAAFNALMREPVFQDLMPTNTTLMYHSSPSGLNAAGFEVYEILGVRNEIELDGSVITDAKVDFDEFNRAKVSMAMNGEGARIWARITGANVNKNVAVVMDNTVYSFPVINERIAGGRTEINGLDSQAEAQDIVNVLKSGALPAPLIIVEERTVGPSLGEASIQAGLNSILVGLLLVALFMIFYYRTAGIVADLALIINVIFILGILAGFKATLTLPGIAGIVLTIGMAVDANVLIFERVREEQNTGKTLKAAMEGGYSKALSAIFDANITTFFVGAILYSFGVGPIKGFAVTLMAGIIASMFSAIVITRIVMDYMVVERRIKVNYG
ncbi:MAG: protein translocase subunit SecD [Bacteroidota bacterium]